MHTIPKSTQVAIAVFYDHISNIVIHNALAIINDNYFVNRPQYGTMFYVLRKIRGKWLIQPYTYKTAQSKGLVFISLVHIGSTTKQAKLVENLLVGSLAAQPMSDPDSLNDWAIDAAFKHVFLSPDSNGRRESIADCVDEYRDYYECEAYVMKVRCGGTFESAIPRYYSILGDFLP